MTETPRQPLLLTVDGRAPKIDPAAWIAPTASVVGAVSLGSGASIWYGAVARADDADVTIGRDTNIQDGAVLHADPGYPCLLGDGVTVGHGAIVHGATVGSGSLVGMGARVLNGARLGERCLVAAGALVPEGFVAPDGMLLVGVPVKVRRELDEDELLSLEASAQEYAANARRHRRCLDDGPPGDAPGKRVSRGGNA